MISDPYKVLGVGANASTDEVKKAYRDLSRKYHPDSYVDNPLSGLAEEKFKEVQEAYKMIMEQRERGGDSFGSRSGNGYASGGSAGNDPVELTAVHNYIASRHYREALDVLNGISNRTARWYYYHALANAGIGNNYEAVNSAKTANSMEPGNAEYSRLVNQLQWGARSYQQSPYGQGAPGTGGAGCGTGNFCCDLWCADTLCECMGGDLCGCF